MNIRKTFCLLALAGVAVLPLGAGAAYDTGATGSANAGATVNAGSGGITGSVDVGGSAGVTTDDRDTSTSSEDQDTDGAASGSAGLTGGLKANALGIEVMSSGQVESDDDLEIFSDNLKVRDENVADANAQAAGTADLTYYHTGKLFGFIPVRMKTHTWVTTQADGSVSVNTTLPWWSAFVTGTGKIRDGVDTALSGSANLSADMRAGADASARARVLEAIASAHARIDGSAGVSEDGVSANADGSAAGSGSVSY